MEELMKTLQTQGMNLLGGIIVLVIGLFLSKWILKFVVRNEAFQKIEPTLRGFLQRFIKLLLYILTFLTAAGVMGIPLTSVVTLLASASVAISLAMQGALSNFVGGMTILLLKPFVVMDYIKIGDTEGTVQSIGVFYTELTTADNRRISLPNSSLTNTAIVNFSREETRRMDKTFGVSYDADMDQVMQTLRSAVEQTPGILSDPAPMIRLSECGDSSLVFTVRVWCKNADYWDVNFDLLENGKRALDRAGIEIPYPQMDVHMKP